MLVKCDFGGQFTNIFTNIGGLNMPRYATLWNDGKNGENPKPIENQHFQGVLSNGQDIIHMPRQYLQKPDG